MKKIKCHLCSYQSNRKSNFDRHVKAMHETCDLQLICCDITFVNKAELKKHYKVVHINGYECKLCGKCFPRRALLMRHMSVHTGIKQYSCPVCVYASSHKSNLERHCLKVHRIQTCHLYSQYNDHSSRRNRQPNCERLRLYLRPYKCLKCQMSFKSQLEFTRHILMSDYTHCTLNAFKHEFKAELDDEFNDESEDLEIFRAAITLTQLNKSYFA